MQLQPISALPSLSMGSNFATSFQQVHSNFLVVNCVVCGQFCINNLFLGKDQASGKDLFACSPKCVNVWGENLRMTLANLTKAIQISTQSILQAPPVTKPQPPRVSIKSKSNKKRSNEEKVKKNRAIQVSSVRSPPLSPKKEENTEVRVEVSSPEKKKVFMVVDTNCFLVNLGNVFSLENHPGITVIVPQVVVRELDGLKKDEKVGPAARNALNSILDAMKATQDQPIKWIRGQSLWEVSNDYVAHNNDDLIINCVLYFRKAFSDAEVILLTNDHGLNIKALTNGIHSMSMSEMTKKLPPIRKGHNKEWSSTFFPSEVAKKQQSNESTKLPYLPEGLWAKVSTFLPPSSVLALSLSSKEFFRLMNKESNDTIWKESIKRTFNDKNGILYYHSPSARQWYLNWRRNTLSR